MVETGPQSPLPEELRLDRYRARLGFWQAIWGTLISGGVAVAIPAAVDAYKAHLDIQKTNAETVLRDKEIELKALDTHQQYIGNFLSTALGQDIELRLRFSEYFSYVSDPRYQAGWQKFHDVLEKRRSAIREDIDSKEKQVQQLLATRTHTLEQQMSLESLQRQLNWRYAELGYVRENSNVTVPDASVPAATRLDLSQIAKENEDAFKMVSIDPDKSSLVQDIVDKIKGNKSKYDTVETATAVPWYVVGVLHWLEADFSFKTHLNGDPLTARTVHIPAGRPAKGDPPFSWEESAIDMITLERIKKPSSLGELLTIFEKHNGFGYRLRGVRSPYLWNCTSFYITGRFIRDHRWDPAARSRMCGAVAILKVLHDQGVIALPPPLGDTALPSGTASQP